MKNRKKPEFAALTTPFEKNIDLSVPWQDYPRPSLVRDSFLSLNGKWNLDTETEKCEITVPFPPQSRLSGTDGLFDDAKEFYYSRKFSLPDGFIRSRVILHFGAVDQYAEVFVNGSSVGFHHGGYLPFEFDITDYLTRGENLLKVFVRDNLSTEYPYGKQRRKRGGMWYTPVSGIWQSVWLESVPENYIKNIKVTPSLDSVKVEVTGGCDAKKLYLGEKEYDFCGDEITVRITDPVLWSPENPHIYNFKLTSGDDEVSSYFALRTVSVCKVGDTPYIALNGRPYFFYGVLDQGYFSDGIYLPATSEGYKSDILNMKKLGFNTLRKHAKIEPEIFYYYCDIYGMIVFQDFVNSGRYNFIFDTALPTAFLKRGVFHYASKFRKNQFEKDAADTVNFLYNHPSVCYYTIFNEGWGQYCSDRIYSDMKKADPTRIWDSTSGWFKSFKSDVTSEHVYFKAIRLVSNKKRPLVLSEFGGYSFKIKDNSYNLSKTYGYKFFEDKKVFEKALEKLFLEEVAFSVRHGLCATVFTQLSDVEDETNGLVTFDRKKVKVGFDFMKAISDKLFEIFDESVKNKENGID